MPELGRCRVCKKTLTAKDGKNYRRNTLCASCGNDFERELARQRREIEIDNDPKRMGFDDGENYD